MVVAVYGGGAYNVLPIDGGGRIGRVKQVIKEIGHGADANIQATAHPHSVVFDDSGKFVVGTDFGCDRINVFAFEDERLGRIERIATPAGSGPSEVWLAESGLEMVVAHRLGGFRARYRVTCRA
jgi:6-phosphogluconolactonase (cycloisomerase 2 family)